MGDKLAGQIKFQSGTYDYTISPSGGQNTPPVYRLTITRQIPAGQSNLVGVVTFEGVDIHAMIENGRLLEAIRDFLKKWIIDHPATG